MSIAKVRRNVGPTLKAVYWSVLRVVEGETAHIEVVSHVEMFFLGLKISVGIEVAVWL